MDAKGRSFVKKAISSGVMSKPLELEHVITGFLVFLPAFQILIIIGGGIPVGGIVMVMEDLESPHHMLLLRYFMAQGLAHGQPLLFASPLSSPRSFLGTLPGLATGDESKDIRASAENVPLKIAWRYRRSDRSQRQQELTKSWSRTQPEQQLTSVQMQDYSSNFDMRKPMERARFNAENVECLNLQGAGTLSQLEDKCATFLRKIGRSESGPHQVGRIALQSLCAPLCTFSLSDWEMMAFLHRLKSTLRMARAVAFISFPAELLKPSFSARWQHIADVLLSVEAVRDDNKVLEAILTDYRDIVGFLRVHKLASINTQVPALSEAGSYAIKVLHKRKVVLDLLQQAPIDTSGDLSGVPLAFFVQRQLSLPII